MSVGDGSAARQDAARLLLRRRLVAIVALALASLALLLALVAWYAHRLANHAVGTSFAEATADQGALLRDAAEHARQRQLGAARKDLQNQCEFLARLLSGVVAAPLLSGDRESIDRSCDELMRHPDVELACLVDDAGDFHSRAGGNLPIVSKRLLAEEGSISARATVLTEGGRTVRVLVIAKDDRLRREQAAIAQDFTDLGRGTEQGFSGLARSLEGSLNRTTFIALGVFALLGALVTILVTVLVRSRIGTVAEEFDRLARRVTGLIDDLGTRTRELELANAAAERGRELLDAVLQRMGEAVVVVDAVGTPLLWNHRARDLLGLSIDDTRAGARHLVESLCDEDGVTPLPVERSPLTIALRGSAVDDRLVHLAGRWLSAGARPLLHADGRLRGAVLVLHDVTELRRANDQLELRVAERTRELAATQARLVEAAHRAGMAEVASEILHNVGNVLTSLNVSAAMIADRIRGSAVDRVAALAGRSRDDVGLRERLPGHLEALGTVLAAEREGELRDLAELRGHLDHVAHIVRQQQGVASAGALIEELDPAALIEDALRIALAGEARPPEIARSFAPLAGFRGDRHRLLQILVNLGVNARRALDGIDRPHIAVAVVAVQGCLRITFADNGCGIAREQLPRLFDLGFTTRADGHGHGRGLHASANAARLMGGALSAASEGPGCGATFTLDLPFG